MTRFNLTDGQRKVWEAGSEIQRNRSPRDLPPSHSELAEKAGVTRQTVATALEHMEALGIVETQPGQRRSVWFNKLAPKKKSE